MTYLHSYFYEMRLRSYYVLFSLFSTFFICYSFQLEILYIIGKPFLEFQHTFVFLELTEAFYTVLRISTSLTFLLICPFLFYHFWSFFVPSLLLQRNKNMTNFNKSVELNYFFLFKVRGFKISSKKSNCLDDNNLNGDQVNQLESRLSPFKAN